MKISSIIRLVIWCLIVAALGIFVGAVVLHSLPIQSNTLMESLYTWGKEQFADIYRILRYSGFRRRFTFFACVVIVFIYIMNFVILKVPSTKKAKKEKVDNNLYQGKVKLAVFEDKKEEK